MSTSYFKSTKAFIHGNSGLRTPQRSAHRELKSSFQKDSNTHKIIVLPTGTGKTGVIGITPFEISDGRVLVITPSLIIREGISDDFDTRSQFNFWTKRNIIIDDNDLPTVYRYVGFKTPADKKRIIGKLNESNIIIANIHKVYSSSSKKALVNLLDKDFFDMIIIDEAHHAEAESWKETLNHFNAKKIVKLTATPFRADNKKLVGEIVYEFSLSDAIKDKYVKNLVAEDYTNQKLQFVIDGEPVNKEKALEIMDSNWLTRTVAYAPECNKTIVDMSIKRLREKRQYGNAHHQIIAVACSIEHAKDIMELYNRAGLTADYVSSDRQDDSEKIIIAFKKGQIDVLVNVNMLGEGFDHPNISIAAIFRPFRSLAPYAQFIGRSLRIIQEGNPVDGIDNIAHVIYHTELDLDELWSYYTGEKEKADRKKIIEVDFESRDFEKNLGVGEVKIDGDIISTTKEFLTDGIGNHYMSMIQASIVKQKKEIDETVKKMQDADIPDDYIREFIENRQRDLEKEVNNKREKLREDLLREELQDAHKNRIIEYVENLLRETGLELTGLELPNNTTSAFLKSSGSNSGYCIKYINSNLKTKLKRGIDEWETYDFEEAEKLVPELVGRLKIKIEGLS
ncbi:DEAD/DEAH box helicase [Peribacillus sp. B-H-3]|uniref:DEAD/DEAH box helicase n=1 Tax=Peribacillus sp. B-H-3 TaxID=3400420 RepID=UPI003B028D62